MHEPFNFRYLRDIRIEVWTTPILAERLEDRWWRCPIKLKSNIKHITYLVKLIRVSKSFDLLREKNLKKRKHVVVI